MIRNLKVLGLAVVAVLAMSAVVASAASAAGERFHSDANPTVITAHSEGDRFTVSGLSVECATGQFSGTIEGSTAASITLHPKYTGCTFFGEAATVTTKGCNYIFTAETVSGHAPVHVECEAAHPHIIVATSSCTMYIGAQSPTAGLTFTNAGTTTETKDVTVKTTVQNIAITKKEGPLCFLLGNSGEYTGTATVKGYVDNGPPLSGSTTEGFVFNEGAQVGVWWE